MLLSEAVVIWTLLWQAVFGLTEPSPVSRISLVAQLRGEIGQGDVEGITLVTTGAGARFRLARTLRLGAIALLLVPAGESREHRHAGTGAGGELALDLMPFPDARVRPFVRTSAGILFFPDTRFLPGGDIYDFILNFGAGLEVPLGARMVLAGNVHYAHLSNGQGIGSFNPAFDAIGMGLELGYALEVPTPPFPEETTIAEGGRPSFSPGLLVDADAGAVSGDSIATGRVRLAERIAPRWLAVVDLEAGELASEPLVELGAGIAGHSHFVSAGIHGGYRNYVGLETFILEGQAEAHVSAETSFVCMGVWERSSLSGDIYRAGAGVRAFPLDSFALDLGVGFDSQRERTADPYFGLEWQLRRMPFSIFVEDQITSIKLAGVRGWWDMGSTLREQARRTGWRRLR